MILVTGATGCLGSHLTRALLARGESVAIFRRETDPLDLLADVVGEVEHRIGDVCDFESVKRAMSGVHRVFNLAGLPPGSAGPLAASDVMWRVHVDGAENVARAACEARVERLVHTSSAAAIGLPLGGEIADETFTFNGDSFSGHHHAYMTSKWQGEQAVLAYVGRGLDAVVVNPCTTMAPGNQGMARMVTMSRQGQLRAYPSGGTALTARADAVDAHIKAMSNGATGERYIVSSINVTYHDLFALIAGVVGSKPPAVRIPNTLMRGASYVATLATAALRRSTMPAMLESDNVFLLTGTFYYSPAKAVRCLGISQSPFEDAVREVADWCQGQATNPQENMHAPRLH